jgi:hypothetical protein
MRVGLWITKREMGVQDDNDVEDNEQIRDI